MLLSLSLKMFFFSFEYQEADEKVWGFDISEVDMDESMGKVGA